MSTATTAPAIQISGVTKTFRRQVERTARRKRRPAPTDVIPGVSLPVGSSVTESIGTPDRGSTGDDVFTALQDIDLSIRKGEFVALVGASGCGKTTLLRMMAGLMDRDRGEIRIDGRLVQGGVPSGVGFVFQEPALLPWKSVHDNLAFALAHKKLPNGVRNAIIDDKLRMTNLTDFRNNYPRQLSGGMQQRAGLARALATDPEVLFLDEPLSALDAFTRRRLQQEIASIIESSGATCVLVTHDVDEAVFFSDRIVVLGSRPGRVIDIIDVPFDRPRTQVELLGNPEAAQIRDRVLELVLGLG